MKKQSQDAQAMARRITIFVVNVNLLSNDTVQKLVLDDETELALHIQRQNAHRAARGLPALHHATA